MKKIEAAIQKAVIRWVKETYPAVMITATQNENSYKETAQIGSLGITDLILFLRINGVMHILFLELKKKKGKLLDSQITWNADFDVGYISTNAVRDVAYGFLEAQEKIIKWVASF